MKKILLFFASLFVGSGLLVWTINAVGLNRIQEAFLAFSYQQGAVILFLTLLIIFIGAWKWKVILKSQGHDLPIRKLTTLYFAGFSISYLFPIFIFGGELFRGHILKEKFSVPQEKAIASV